MPHPHCGGRDLSRDRGRPWPVKTDDRRACPGCVREFVALTRPPLKIEVWPAGEFARRQEIFGPPPRPRLNSIGSTRIQRGGRRPPPRSGWRSACPTRGRGLGRFHTLVRRHHPPPHLALARSAGCWRRRGAELLIHRRSCDDSKIGHVRARPGEGLVERRALDSPRHDRSS